MRSLDRSRVHHHTQAQNFRRRCVQEQQPELCTRAQEQYRLAAEAYRGYIQRYPNNPQAYELQYNLADALFWSENYEEAAREYSAVTPARPRSKEWSRRATSYHVPR